MTLMNRYASLERRDVRSPSSDSTSTLRKTASGNCCKNFWGPKGHIKSYGIFEPTLWSRAKSPWSDRVVIPFLLQGKQRLETLVKI
jgi:hypothetical protein